MGACLRPTRIVALFFGRRLAFLTLSSTVFLFFLGCGSSGDPVAGQILRAIGFFSQSGTPPVYAPDTGDTFSLSATTSIPGSGSDLGFVGLENLQGLTPIITTAANLSYTIPGSTFLVPDDVFSFSANLPASGGTTATVVYIQLQLVSAARMNFLRENSTSLPPVPFDMTVTVTVDGESPSGQMFVSNPVSYTITFTE
ncbi:MAG TPA: hypothetical protein VMB26_10345 [Candidatus Binataceae bacterium]|nr:hypothetical protein [Candidatus Binataceae bacterium]